METDLINESEEFDDRQDIDLNVEDEFLDTFDEEDVNDTVDEILEEAGWLHVKMDREAIE
jgi:hypothetical protein